MLTLRTAAAALLGAALLAACGEKKGAQDITGAEPGARVKFFNFGVNAPGVNFYANDTKATAISSTTGTESALGTAFGSVSSGGFYSGMRPGQYTFTARIAAATDKDLVIASVPATLAQGRSYSYYLSGIYDAAGKKSDAFIVEDPFDDTIDYGATTVRFVNAIANAQPMTLFVRHTVTGVETAVGGAVAYKAAGAFVKLPGGVYDLNLRTAGSTANAVSRTGVSFSPGRVYTVATRGDMTVTSTTAATRPQIDVTANR